MTVDLSDAPPGPERRTASCVTGWGVVSLPTTFFIDRDGVVRQVEIGPLTRERPRTDLAGLTPP